MSAGSSGDRRHEVVRARAGRTFVALMGVASIALTAAAAEPLGPRELAATSGVFALGEDGLGSIGMLSLDPDGPGRPGGPGGPGGEEDGSGEGAGTRPTWEGGASWTRRAPGGVPGGSLGLGLGLQRDGAVEVGVLGEETFASVVPAGFGGAAGIPGPTLRAYRAAAAVLAREAPGCRIDWALLAGIGRVEANHGRFGGAVVTDQGVSVPRILGPRLDGSLEGTMVIRDSDGGTLDGDAAYDRAVGPMQFLPGTWKRWGSDGDRDGARDPQDIDDAALAAARYLCEGRSGLDQRAQAASAVRRYNNSSSYVELVLSTAEGYRSGGAGTVAGTGTSTGSGFDPDGGYGFGDGRGRSPFSGEAPPPGWKLPPGTVVGAGPATTPTGSSGSPSPATSASPSPSTPATSPTPSSPPPASTPATTPTGSPSGTATTSPSGPATGPTTSAGPTDGPTTVSPSPADPSCAPAPTDPSTGPTTGPTGEPSLAPCPSPCGTPPPSAEPSGDPTSEPSAAPTSEPSTEPSGGPTCTVPPEAPQG